MRLIRIRRGVSTATDAFGEQKDVAELLKEHGVRK